ncbi:MAG: energy-coupling factor ABC transporter permease [Syntrophobacteraceae bacterium]
MHMADALISPAVGGAMWAATAGLTAYSARQLKKEMDERKIPLMGVLGALVFAAQMINFTIPGTGSSGHFGGGLLLAVLLGPHAAFLTMASIITIQALFFADGGLLALGCNIFNMGFFPCFVAFPFIYKKIAANSLGHKRIIAAAIVASIIGFQLGAAGVVVETVFSGISELPFRTFVLLMMPVHLAIGLVEGFVTASLVGFVRKMRPEVLEMATGPARNKFSIKPLLITLIVIAIFTGGLLSWFASANPDGLEWSIARIYGNKELENPESRIHSLLSGLQEKIALLPGYDFRKQKDEQSTDTEGKKGKADAWPSVSAGTSISGLVGGAMSLALAGLIGFGIKIFQKRKPK